jgi:5'-nucleotidase (lipoprotein e(P4) family)
MKKSYIYFFAGILLLNACSSTKTITKSTSTVNNGKVWALLWQQQAAEYKALCYQAWNIARLRLDEALIQPAGKPLAIVTDIDETLLDNSAYDAKRAIDDSDYTSKTWKVWTAKGIADTVPGAPAFFKYAASKGVEVFYITNRDADERAGTLKNLRLYNLPDADDAHLVFRQSGSSKEARRQAVMQTHNVILLCGDNLADFDALYDNKPSVQSRKEATDKLIQQFGSRYIVLPNATYGDWESALFNFNYKLSSAQKDSIIKAQLKLDK